ncbi:MAG: hypothetical protein EPN93_17405 [Spirochaetes bacterium]|nr:MAG: hypothetical protein EPN93_17405 [Spirochaetota bacterium]
MYDAMTISQAFMLYCQGHSFRKIAEMLKSHPGCETLTHGTVKGWAEKKDETGLTWEDRRRDYTALMRAGEKQAVVRTQEQVIEETSSILNEIIDEIRSGDLEFKTKDAAVYALKALSEWQQKIVDKGKRVTVEEQMDILFEVMYEITEVSQVLLKHQEAILRKFQERTAERLREKNGR